VRLIKHSLERITLTKCDDEYDIGAFTNTLFGEAQDRDLNAQIDKLKLLSRSEAEMMRSLNLITVAEHSEVLLRLADDLATMRSDLATSMTTLATTVEKGQSSARSESRRR
jgi:hypothetical protein